MHTPRTIAGTLLAQATATLVPVATCAQQVFPSRTIKSVVTFGPDSDTDEFQKNGIALWKRIVQQAKAVLQ